MRIAETFFANSASLVVRLGANFALNKILALLIGPASFAILGQLQNFLMVMQNATSGLLINGVTKLTAQARGDIARERQIWSTALSAVVLLTLIAALVIVIAREWIAVTLLGDAIYVTPLVLSAVTLTAFGLSFLIATIFAGKSDVRPFAIINMAIALINLTVIGAGAYFGAIEGALMAAAISQSLSLLIGVFLMYRRNWYGFRLARPFVDPATLKTLAKYSAMAIVATGALAIGQLIVRSQIIAEFGLVTAGIYEALWRLSTINQLIFSSTLLVYALPRMSQLTGEAAFRGFYAKALLAASVLAGIIFGIEYLLRGPMFYILFSSAFEPATQYFGYQAVGDVARVTTLVTSTALIALSRAGFYIALEIIRFAIFVSASHYLMQSHASDGPALAYMLSFCASALIGVAMMMIAGNGKAQSKEIQSNGAGDD